MWTSAPTPVTTRSMTLLKSSIITPMGTCRPGRSIHGISFGFTESGPKKTKMLASSEKQTAPTEIVALRPRDLRRKSWMSTALTSGARRMNQGK